MYYILDESNEPVNEPNFYKWFLWFRDNNHRRSLALDLFKDTRNDLEVKISTVFLGVEHLTRYNDSGPKLLWETMIFGGKYSPALRRYGSRHDAFHGHRRAVLIVETNSNIIRI